MRLNNVEDMNDMIKTRTHENDVNVWKQDMIAENKGELGRLGYGWVRSVSTTLSAEIPGRFGGQDDGLSTS